MWVKLMSRKVELPLIEPIYGTYHSGAASAIIKDRPGIRNFYLNDAFILSCSKKFLEGHTTPDFRIVNEGILENPHIHIVYYYTRFLYGCTDKLIRNLIDNGYYVYFTGVDDYYIEGKSWYNKRHFDHDGLICGYDNEKKTYCIYAYDENWLYRKFWIPQKSFERGRVAITKTHTDGALYGMKARDKNVRFSIPRVYKNLKKYLDSDLRKYPLRGKGNAYGIVVHKFLAEYVAKLYGGSIPYERMDWRIFRLLWEHKKFMLERILRIEKLLKLDDSHSRQYTPLIAKADKMRMLYASHHMRRRDSVLPILKRELLEIHDEEYRILSSLVKAMEKEF